MTRNDQIAEQYSRRAAGRATLGGRRRTAMYNNLEIKWELRN